MKRTLALFAHGLAPWRFIRFFFRGFSYPNSSFLRSSCSQFHKGPRVGTLSVMRFFPLIVALLGRMGMHFLLSKEHLIPQLVAFSCSVKCVQHNLSQVFELHITRFLVVMPSSKPRDSRGKSVPATSQSFDHLYPLTDPAHHRNCHAVA